MNKKVEIDAKNQFLIAMPALMDITFFHAVVYICLHSKEGGMGFLVNKPLSDLTFAHVMTQMKIPYNNPTLDKVPVLLGGPVQPERGFVLHPFEHEWESTMRTAGHLAVTTSQDILHAIATGKGPQQFLLCLGYAGWGAGEIEQEVAENDWIIAPFKENILFDIPFDTRWKYSMAELGIDIEHLSTDTGHA